MLMLAASKVKREHSPLTCFTTCSGIATVQLPTDKYSPQSLSLWAVCWAQACYCLQLLSIVHSHTASKTRLFYVHTPSSALRFSMEAAVAEASWGHAWCVVRLYCVCELQPHYIAVYGIGSLTSRLVRRSALQGRWRPQRSTIRTLAPYVSKDILLLLGSQSFIASSPNGPRQKPNITGQAAVKWLTAPFDDDYHTGFLDHRNLSNLCSKLLK